MNIIDKYKALIITFLLTGILVFSMFSIHLTQASPLIAETFIDITPQLEDLNEPEELEETRSINSNKAFNEDQEFKELMKNFKSVNADDLKERIEKTIADKENPNVTESKSSYQTHKSFALNETEKKKYESLKKTLENTVKTDKLIGDHSKDMSSLSYSLKDRTMLSYKTPRYLCEIGGKVVVSIVVNNKGKVINASINNASNTTNQCLIDNALEYANSIQFNSGLRNEQLGTVSFYFKNKLTK